MKKENKLSKTEILLQRLTYLSHYSSALDYDYESGYSCQYECDNHCHHRIITQTKVKSISSSFISELLNDKAFTHHKPALELSEIEEYCVDRFFRSAGMLDSDNWKVNVSSGYYGEEVSGCTIELDFSSKLEDLFKLSDLDKIKFVLQEEYGHTIDLVESKTSFEIINVAVSEVEFGNQNHLRKLNKRAVTEYLKHSGIMCICHRVNGKLHILDGYHRMAAANQSKTLEVKVIVLS